MSPALTALPRLPTDKESELRCHRLQSCSHGHLIVQRDHTRN